MPPPLPPLTMPPGFTAVLSLIVQLSIVTLPFSMKIPPPTVLVARPPLMVRLERVTVAPPRMCRTRSLNPLPLMIVVAWFAPCMVRLSLISRSPVAERSSPAPAALKTYSPIWSLRIMVSVLPFALDSCMAARRVQTPLPTAVSQTPSPRCATTVSAVLLTVKVFACPRLAAARPNTNRHPRMKERTREDEVRRGATVRPLVIVMGVYLRRCNFISGTLGHLLYRGRILIGRITD